MWRNKQEIIFWKKKQEIFVGGCECLALDKIGSNCMAALLSLAADLSQNISETEVAPDAIVQKCSVLFAHAHG